MSYTRSQKRRVVSRVRRRRTGLSGLLDEMLSVTDADYSACSDTADQQTAPIDAMAGDLSKNWNVTDNVPPADLRKIVDQVMAMQRSGRMAIEKAMESAPETQKGLLYQMLANMDDIGQQSGNYYAAALTAQSSGSAVAAPGLKKWVVDSILKVSSATHAASVVLCQIPWWVAALGAITSAVQGVVGVAKTVGGIVLTLGEKAVSVVEGGFALVATIEKYAPVGIFALAAWWLFLREGKRSSHAV